MLPMMITLKSKVTQSNGRLSTNQAELSSKGLELFIHFISNMHELSSSSSTYYITYSSLVYFLVEIVHELFNQFIILSI